jgi:hypothetical protein
MMQNIHYREEADQDYDAVGAPIADYYSNASTSVTDYEAICSAFTGMMVAAQDS